MPTTPPSARLHARRFGVTPPRSWRSSGRKTLHRNNSRTDSGTSSTMGLDAGRSSLISPNLLDNSGNNFVLDRLHPIAGGLSHR
jgi:hypothetical protein